MTNRQFFYAIPNGIGLYIHKIKTFFHTPFMRGVDDESFMLVHSSYWQRRYLKRVILKAMYILNRLEKLHRFYGDIDGVRRVYKNYPEFRRIGKSKEHLRLEKIETDTGYWPEVRVKIVKEANNVALNLKIPHWLHV